MVSDAVQSLRRIGSAHNKEESPDVNHDQSPDINTDQADHAAQPWSSLISSMINYTRVQAESLLIFEWQKFEEWYMVSTLRFTKINWEVS